MFFEWIILLSSTAAVPYEGLRRQSTQRPHQGARDASLVQLKVPLQHEDYKMTTAPTNNFTRKTTTTTQTAHKPQSVAWDKAAADSDFASLLKSNQFVDKTAFIRWVSGRTRPIYIAAPRSFGKTSALKMLKMFYEIPVDINGSRIPLKDSYRYRLFTDQYFKINPRKLTVFSEGHSFLEDNMGRYAVLDLNFGCLETKSLKDFLDSVRSMIQNAFDKMPFLRDPQTNQLEESRIFFSQLEVEGSISLSTHAIKSVQHATAYLSTYFDVKCLVLIDEMDAPIQKMLRSKIGPEQHKIIECLRGMARELLKNNDSVSRSVCVGQTSLARVFLLEADNVDYEDFHLNPEVAKFLGSTYEEIRGLEQQYLNGGKKIDLSVVESYYGSYQIMNPYEDSKTLKLFNTFSVRQYFKLGKPLNFWCTTGSTLISRVLNMKGVMNLIRDAILGHATLIYTETSLEFDMIRDLQTAFEAAKESRGEIDITYSNVDLVMQYLFELGYLTTATLYSSTNFMITIPNQEIKEHLTEVFLAWTKNYFKYPGRKENAYVKSLERLAENAESQQVLIDCIADFFADSEIVPKTMDMLINPILCLLKPSRVKPELKFKLFSSRIRDSKSSILLILKYDKTNNKKTCIILGIAFQENSKVALDETIRNMNSTPFHSKPMQEFCKSERVNEFIIVGLNLHRLSVSGHFLFNSTRVELAEQFKSELDLFSRH